MIHAACPDFSLLQNASRSGVDHVHRRDPGTQSIELLKLEGYVESDGVDEAHVRLVDGEDSYIACVQHRSTGGWLVDTSAEDTSEPATEDCAAA